ncbi:MAG: hypothetical protein HZC11_00360 [Nitrospirae bacterium]|nr:hypothetical protein [Nitrospirota bacterium]
MILNPDDSVLPEKVSNTVDWKTILYFKGKYNLITKEKVEGTVGYSFYQNLHTNLNDYNVSQHLLELKGSYALSPLLNFKGLYSYEYVFVGEERYNYASNVSPSLIISEGKGLSTVLEYRFRHTRLQDSVLFENNSDRTGINHLIGLTQNIPVSANILGRIGYFHDEESTRRDYWNYRGNKGSAGVRCSLPGNTLVDLSTEYYDKNYEGINSSSGEDRHDKAVTGTISATKLLSKDYSVTASYLHTRNDSNTAAYDYKRGITSVFLNVRF